MKYYGLLGIIIITVIFIITKCASDKNRYCITKECSNNNYKIDTSDLNIETFDCTNFRELNKDTVFLNERKFINERRKANKRPHIEDSKSETIGLALSGGGIRSNSFQLGLLCSLVRKKKGDKRFIDYIDYISSVSGGSWASGAYKAYKGNDEAFFSEIEAKINEILDVPGKDSDEIKNNSSDPEKKINKKYENAVPYLVNQYMPIKEFITFYNFEARNMNFWKNFIAEHYLNIEKPDENEGLYLSDLIKEPYNSRPYIIINGSHTAHGISFFDVDKERSFPFEFTADKIGTIADFGNTCGYHSWWQVSGWGTSYKAAFISADSEVYINRFKFHEYGYKNRVSLAEAMAISSGVLKIVGNLKRNILFTRKHDGNAGEYRQRYKISDGGHFENFGAFGLIERGVSTIIISDAGGDDDYEYSDIKLLDNHTRNLLKIQILPNESVTLDKKLEKIHQIKENHRDYEKNNEYYEKMRKINLTYDYLESEKGDQQVATKKRIIYLKPVCSDDFWAYIKQYDKKEVLHKYIDGKERKKFPMDVTIDHEYEIQRIIAYYYLGKFYGELLIKENVFKNVK